MGNQLAPPQRLPVEHLSELPHVVYKETLGEPLQTELEPPSCSQMLYDTMAEVVTLTGAVVAVALQVAGGF